MAVDPRRRYLLSDADVDIHDRAFVQSLTPAQFNDLLAQSLNDPHAAPADLDGKPTSLREGDAVVFFTPPSGDSDSGA